MKKLVALILAAAMALSLVACSSSSETEADTIDETEIEETEIEDIEDEEEIAEENENYVENAEMTLSISDRNYEGSYTGDVNENKLPDGVGVFTYAVGDYRIWTYDGEWNNGHISGQGIYTTESGRRYEGGWENDKYNGNGELLTEDGLVYNGIFIDGEFTGNGTLYLENGSYLAATFSGLEDATDGEYYDEDGSYYSAYMEEGKIYLTKPNDFFSDESRQEEYKALYTSYQFNALNEYMNEYISDEGNDVETSDSAYEILGIIEPILEHENSWVVEVDDFDSSYTVTFPGADAISSTQSVKVTVTGYTPTVTVGFRKSGWLFFDKYALSVNGEVVDSHSIKSWDRNDDIISGGTIEENYIFTLYSDDDFANFDVEDTVVLRFTNTDDEKTYDHTLTNEEKNALIAGAMLNGIYKDLSDLQFRFNNNTIKIAD